MTRTLTVVLLSLAPAGCAPASLSPDDDLLLQTWGLPEWWFLLAGLAAATALFRIARVSINRCGIEVRGRA